MMWIPVWAAGVVNGLGHAIGYRNFECRDAATNLVPWGILIGGEELHNNHHSFATSAKLSSKWYEFDIGWMYIRILSMLGMAKVKKTIPTPKFGEAKKVVDFDMLQAVVTHRYDVMRRYAASLKSIYAEEIAKLASSHGPKFELKEFRRWLNTERTGAANAIHQKFEDALSASPRLEKLEAMKNELAALWARSSASREQLVSNLQDWCARAEASGIRQLEEFSTRLRRYA